MKGDTSALRTSIYFNIVFVGLDPHGPLAAQSHLSVCMEREVRKVALDEKGGTPRTWLAQ